MTGADHGTAGTDICEVTYRGTAPDRREVEVRLRTSSAAATLADAWRRLCAVHGEVDPRTLEVEIRSLG